jgi:iron(III) transport system ATP-binding protein
VTALAIEGLTASFADTPVLRELDLAVATGSLTAVLGPSGCGKTTLLRAVAGFVRPQRGTISIDGRQVTGDGLLVPPERRGIGLVPQDGALFPHLSVGQNVAFGLPRGSRRGSARIGEVLELVGLSGFERRRPQELSGGQQQRVALARALAPGPALVLLDEPFSALDAGLRDAVRADVRAVLKSAGTTAVLVTHDQDEALSIADSVAVMGRGRVLMNDTPHRVYAAPDDLGVARFVGQLVELAATICGGRARTELGDIPLADGTRSGSPPEGAIGVLTLRPEQLVLLPSAAAEGVPGVVRRTAFYGHDTTVTVTVGPDHEPTATTVLVRTASVAGGRPAVRLKVNGCGRFFPSSESPA